MILEFFKVPCVTLDSTELKIFLDLILAIDLSKFKLVKGSPSSNNSPLMTDSLVILFPTIFILSTKFFGPSLIINLILIESPSIDSHYAQQIVNYYYRLIHQFPLKAF